MPKSLKYRYQVVTATSASELEREVNRELRGGWCLAGGVAVARSGTGLDEGNEYAQALVRPLTERELEEGVG